jgi:hypothetical protein
MNKKFIIKWRRHWNVLKRFSTGYNPNAAVIGKMTEENDDPSGCSPEEAYWAYQERGIILPCSNQVKKNEYLERKACMDLTVSMWKETILENQKSSSAYVRVLVPQAEVLELAAAFPISFLEKVGLLKMVDLTIKQCGFRLGKRKSILTSIDPVI